MNIYLIEFMEYTNGLRDAVYNEELNKTISVNKNGFVAKETDLSYLNKFGKGFRTLNFVGQLYQGDKNPLVVNVSCNLVGKEDIEKTIAELEEKLSNLKVSIKV